MTTTPTLSQIPAAELVKDDRIVTYRGMATITDEPNRGDGVGFHFQPDDCPSMNIYCTSDPEELTWVVR